jgi:hypothetical protein
MENLKSYLTKKGMFSRVDFDDREVHTFEVLKGKEIEYPDSTSSYKMLVKENGEYKIVSTPTILIEIRDCQPGDVFEAQLKYRNIGGKTPIRDYQVKKIKSGKPTEKVEEAPDIKEEEIPIKEDEGTEGEEPPKEFMAL